MMRLCSIIYQKLLPYISSIGFNFSPSRVINNQLSLRASRFLFFTDQIFTQTLCLFPFSAISKPTSLWTLIRESVIPFRSAFILMFYRFKDQLMDHVLKGDGCEAEYEIKINKLWCQTGAAAVSFNLMTKAESTKLLMLQESDRCNLMAWWEETR